MSLAKIGIDPAKELFQWGPIPGRLIYPDYFNAAFTRHQKTFGISWPNVLGVFAKDKMTFLAELDKLTRVGEKHLRKFVLNRKNFRKYYRVWIKLAEHPWKLLRIINSEVLRDYGHDKLRRLYKDWFKYYQQFWVVGFLPELSAWGAEPLLKNLLSGQVEAKDFIKVYERLSAPEKLSFYQQADLELLRLKKYEESPKILMRKLKQYQQRHFWILNSYYDTRVLPVSYFKKQFRNVSALEAKRKIKELEDYPSRVVKQKATLVKNYHLSRVVVRIARVLAFCVWWQDWRKYHIFLANHFIEEFLREFSRRFKVKLEDLHYYNPYELWDLVAKQKKLSTQEIRRRKRCIAVYYSQARNRLYYFSGSKAKKIWQRYLVRTAPRNLRSFNGLVVSRGPLVKGKARVIMSPVEASKMKKGDILVAGMTSPDYILAIKKASAIVTDAGGMTSHAAIVSRELGVPCIVGTRIATKVVKDGDIIEVDANRGMIKILKRHGKK